MDLVSDLAPKGVQLSLTKAKEHFLNENWSPPKGAFLSKQGPSLLPLKGSLGRTISLNIGRDSSRAKTYVLGAEGQKGCKNWPAVDGLYQPAIRMMNTCLEDLYLSLWPGKVQNDERYSNFGGTFKFYSWLEKL